LTGGGLQHPFNLDGEDVVERGPVPPDDRAVFAIPASTGC
jgi:hypothetical protein